MCAFFTALLMGMLLAGSASASPWPSDPRVCPAATQASRVQCLIGNAKIAVIRAHGSFLSFECRATAKPLHAACPTNRGFYAVVFSKSAGRWWVKVTP